MNALDALRTPESEVLTLHTLTPLYTGGVGQHGDQIHPSGILGGIRRFSCLLAAALGDGDFEYEVWGTPGDTKVDDRHAKRIGLKLDCSALQKIALPTTAINWERPDGGKRKGWYFNSAHEGVLELTLSRRGIVERHWQILLLALRIQLRHATLGAKDQFGLGVMRADVLPVVVPLSTRLAAPLDKPGLQNAFFAEVMFDCPPSEDLRTRLECGLRWREKLRGSLRKPDWDDLRHYLFGELNRWGSAVNVSAVYPREQGCALRIWGVLPHTHPARFADRREQVISALHDAVHQGPDKPMPAAIADVSCQDGGMHTERLADWINRLAGVTSR